jgi:chemotaxis protein MotB
MAAQPKAKGGDDAVAPIIIKKIKKGGHGGHHGGSWKVAFADFATAMMAFFLLMWLMGATTEKQKGAISEYFNNPSNVQGSSPVPSPTPVQGPGGASTSMIDAGGGMELHREAPPPEPTDQSPPTPGTQTEVVAGKGEEEADKERLNGLLTQLKAAIDERQSLAQYKNQILLDVTLEGVRIQIVDEEPHSMFPLGSSTLEPFSKSILLELANIVNKVPNKVSISGHTDIKPFVAMNYSNWELSADRANAARRALIQGGVSDAKIGRVVGLASSVLLKPDEPDSSVNRRISIVVMNKRTEDAISQENGNLLIVQGPNASDPASAPTAAAEAAPAPAPAASH